MASVSDILSRPAEEFGNDADIEMAWVMKATQHMEIYFNLITSVDPRILKLTRYDDDIYKEFRNDFADLSIKSLDTENLKSNEAKEKWRHFCEKFNHVKDYNFGTILRLHSEGEYSDSNSIFVPRIQFYAIEIARNREGFNDTLSIKYKPDNTVNNKEENINSNPLGSTITELSKLLDKKKLTYSIKIEHGTKNRGDLSLHLKNFEQADTESVCNFIMDNSKLLPLSLSTRTKGMKDQRNSSYSKIEINLSRNTTFSISIKLVSQLSNAFGSFNNRFETAWILPQPSEKEQVRRMILSQHLCSLVKANGYRVCCSEDLESQNVIIDIKSTHCPHCNAKFESHLTETIEKLNLEELFDGSLKCNLENYNLFSNINLPKLISCIVKKDNEFSKALLVANKLSHLARCDPKENPNIVYYVTSNADAHKTQLIASLWNLLGTKMIKHVIFVHGPVLFQGVDPEADHLQTLKLDSVRKVMTQKYGLQILDDPEWAQRINVLAKTALKFECLSVSPLCQVLVGCDPRAGCFIQYNCSRLNALFQRYNEEIQKGTIKCCDIEKIDFSLLKKDEEWQLLYRYVLLYPIIIEECIDYKQKLPLHRICVLLQQLSKDFSQYYSRVKLFTPFSLRNPDLLHARLNLLMAVYQVFKSGLNLVQLEPLLTM